MNPSVETSRRSLFAFRVAFIAAIGGFLFGFDLGMIGAANVYLRDQFDLTDAQFGFVTASATLGCVFGPFLGSWLCDAIGRKRTMLIAAALLAVSAIFTAIPDLLCDGSDHQTMLVFNIFRFNQTMLVFNIFRFIGGLGVGLCSIASPMYIAEIAPPARRGGLGMMYQLAIVVGHAVAPLIAFVVIKILSLGFGVTEGVIPESPWLQAWRWMFFSETVCVTIFVLFVVGLPFSPRWLAEKGNFDKAKEVLVSVDGPEHAEQEMVEIRSSLQQQAGSWWDLFAPGLRYALLIGVLLAFFNNWTGWSVIGGYIPRLFELSGFDRESAIGNFVAVYGAMGLMTLVSLLLLDRVGRRPLWIVASLAMAVITGVTGYLFHQEVTGWPVLIILILVTVPHGLALGGLPWLMMSELFPTNLRAKAVSITTTTLWVFIFSGAYLFPLITGSAQEQFLTARQVQVSGKTIAFVESDPAHIENRAGDFVKEGFRPLDQVTVLGATADKNNRTFLIDEVTPHKLVLGPAAKLTAEPAGAEVTLQIGSVGPPFWLFSGICILSVLFGLTIMPETKGRTLEEIGTSWK